MVTFRQYSTLDHDDVWRIHLLVIAEAGVEASHQHYHDIFHIDDLYLKKDGEFLVGTDTNGMVIAMGGLKKLNDGKAEIKRLRVHPDYQKLGLGQKLLTKLEQRAIELGYRHLILDTLANQHNAQKLFLRNQYERIGPAVIDGFNVVLFEKTLVS